MPHQPPIRTCLLRIYVYIHTYMRVLIPAWLQKSSVHMCAYFWVYVCTWMTTREGFIDKCAHACILTFVHQALANPSLLCRLFHAMQRAVKEYRIHAVYLKSTYAKHVAYPAPYLYETTPAPWPASLSVSNLLLWGRWTDTDSRLSTLLRDRTTAQSSPFHVGTQGKSRGV